MADATGKPSWTREKRLAYNRKYWKTNKAQLLAGRSKYYAQSNSYSQKRRHKNKARALNFKKEVKCIQCGFSHPAALHFHHLDPSLKEFEIMKVLSSNRKIDWEVVEEEVEKCVLLCANCHLIEHTTFTDVLWETLRSSN